MEFACITASIHGTPLFPRLKALAINSGGTLALQSLLPLLQSELREITLVIHDASDLIILLFLRAISRRCPHLRRISAHFGYNDREPSDDLGSLTLPPNVVLHPVVWTAAGAQPHLRELGWIPGDADVDDYEPRSQEPPAPPPKFASGQFQGLQSLSLLIHHKSASLLFSDPTPSAIEDLALELVGDPGVRQFTDLLSLLAQSAQTLLGLDLTCRASLAIGRKHLHPIFMHQLLRLHVRLDLALALSDEDLRAIAQSIPGITQLSLTPDPVFIPPAFLPTATATLKALESFAEFCPMLTELSLWLDAGSNCSDGQPSPSQHVFKHLRRLNFGWSPCPKPLFAAHYICSVIGTCDLEIVSEPCFSPRSAPSLILTKSQLAKKRQWEQVSGFVSIARVLYAKIVDLNKQMEELRRSLRDRHGP
jgi:hypothetical protein